MARKSKLLAARKEEGRIPNPVVRLVIGQGAASGGCQGLVPCWCAACGEVCR